MPCGQTYGGREMRVGSRLIILVILTTILVTKSESLYSAPLPSDNDVSGIVKACAGGRSQQIEGDLEAKIELWKRGAQISGKASKEDLGAILKEVPANQQISPELYKTYTDCILNAMSKYLTSIVPRHLSPTQKEELVSDLRDKKIKCDLIYSLEQETASFAQDFADVFSNAGVNFDKLIFGQILPPQYGIFLYDPKGEATELAAALRTAKIPFVIAQSRAGDSPYPPQTPSLTIGLMPQR